MMFLLPSSSQMAQCIYALWLEIFSHLRLTHFYYFSNSFRDAQIKLIMVQLLQGSKTC